MTYSADMINLRNAIVHNPIQRENRAHCRAPCRDSQAVYRYQGGVLHPPHPCIAGQWPGGTSITTHHVGLMPARLMQTRREPIPTCRMPCVSFWQESSLAKILFSLTCTSDMYTISAPWIGYYLYMEFAESHIPFSSISFVSALNSCPEGDGSGCGGAVCRGNHVPEGLPPFSSWRPGILGEDSGLVSFWTLGGNNPR